MIFSAEEIPENTRLSVTRLSAKKRLPQSVMLTGGSSALREKCAIELAMAANCKNLTDGQPCKKCPDCIKAAAGSHPDMIFVTPEKNNKTVSKDRLKELVIDRLYVAPNEAENSIYIFPDAQELSENNQNMLLKTIEEPPGFAMFVFECEQREDMLPTIISRCTEFHLGDTLSSKTKKEDEKVTAIACGIINAMCKKTEYGVMTATSPMLKNRALMKKVAVKIITVVRDAAVQNSKAELLSGCEEQAIALSINFSTAQLIKIKEAMDEIISFADSNANENLLISKFSISLCQI